MTIYIRNKDKKEYTFSNVLSIEEYKSAYVILFNPESLFYERVRIWKDKIDVIYVKFDLG